MERIWLKSYEPGVPSDIDPDKYSSLNELFNESFKKYAELPAFTNMGKTIDYATLERQAKIFAAYLQNNYQIAKGDRFAIMMPNILQYPIAMLGILLAGGTVVNVNPLYTPDELEYQLQDSQAIGIIVLENFAHTLAAVINRTPVKHVIVTKISDVLNPPKSWLVDIVLKYVKHMIPKWKLDNFTWYKSVLEKGQQYTYNDPQLKGTDLAFLQYTGGTTGRAKGAMLTHRNMVANMEQAVAWMSQTIEQRKEIIITALPLYHIFSLTANCLTFLQYGALNVLITNPRDVPGFIKELKKHKFTTFTGVNTLFNLLLNHPLFATVDFSALRLSLGGGMAVQEAVAQRWQKLTKCRLLEAYGLTETAPAVCINPMNLQSYNGSIGLPISSTYISVRDDHGQELGIGQTGELWVRGPQVMKGYWRQEAETNNVLSPEGWLRTGDVVVVDELGFVRIVDRIKDIINVSGFKVYPNEIEGVLAKMPQILESAVIGVIDPAQGESVKAFIVKKDPNLTEKMVLDFCHEHLTGYKIPRHIEFRGSLPKTNVGKVLRRALR